MQTNRCIQGCASDWRIKLSSAVRDLSHGLQEKASKRRKCETDRIRAAMGLDLCGSDFAKVAYAAPSVVPGVAVEDLPPMPADGDPHGVAISGDRGPVAYHQDRVLPGLGLPHERHDAVVGVPVVYPFEAAGSEVQFVHGGVGPKESVEVPHPPLNSGVRILTEEGPVQCFIVIPFVPDAELVSHEQELFPGMSVHVSKQQPQVRELLPGVTRELLQQ